MLRHETYLEEDLNETIPRIVDRFVIPDFEDHVKRGIKFSDANKQYKFKIPRLARRYGNRHIQQGYSVISQ